MIYASLSKRARVYGLAGPYFSPTCPYIIAPSGGDVNPIMELVHLLALLYGSGVYE
jgi:hypothetical protein